MFVCVSNKERDHGGLSYGTECEETCQPSCHLRLFGDLAVPNPRVGSALKETRSSEFFRVAHESATHLSQASVAPSVTPARPCRTERTKPTVLHEAELKSQWDSGLSKPTHLCHTANTPRPPPQMLAMRVPRRVTLSTQLWLA